MNYWIHRCAYMGGHDILDKEHRLTIGFSDCAKDPDMAAIVKARNGKKFDPAYEKVYGGEIWRARWSLWYFACEMEAGDIVVVPRSGAFEVVRLKREPILSERRHEKDIGWEWEVEPLADICSPRDAYASEALLRRMKCRQTTISINDLSEDVEAALVRFRENRPFSLASELTRKCHELLGENGSPGQFEGLLRDYFMRLGGAAEILSKNYSGKVGDCDIEAVFPALRLTISVQAKKHSGLTGDWAVRQIADYAKARRDEGESEPNWTYALWVVSFADDFSDEAKAMARKEGVVLINGVDFCKMLVAGGLGLD